MGSGGICNEISWSWILDDSQACAKSFYCMRLSVPKNSRPCRKAVGVSFFAVGWTFMSTRTAVNTVDMNVHPTQTSARFAVSPGLEQDGNKIHGKQGVADDPQGGRDCNPELIVSGIEQREEDPDGCGEDDCC